MTRKREQEIRNLLLAELLATKKALVRMKRLMDELLREAGKQA